MASFLCCIAAMPKELFAGNAIDMCAQPANQAPHPIDGQELEPTPGTAPAAGRIARAAHRPRRLAAILAHRNFCKTSGKTCSGYRARNRLRPSRVSRSRP